MEPIEIQDQPIDELAEELLLEEVNKELQEEAEKAKLIEQEEGIDPGEFSPQDLNEAFGQ